MSFRRPAEPFRLPLSLADVLAIGMKRGREKGEDEAGDEAGDEEGEAPSRKAYWSELDHTYELGRNVYSGVVVQPLAEGSRAPMKDPYIERDDLFQEASANLGKVQRLVREYMNGLDDAATFTFNGLTMHLLKRMIENDGQLFFDMLRELVKTVYGDEDDVPQHTYRKKIKAKVKFDAPSESADVKRIKPGAIEAEGRLDLLNGDAWGTRYLFEKVCFVYNSLMPDGNLNAIPMDSFTDAARESMHVRLRPIIRVLTYETKYTPDKDAVYKDMTPGVVKEMVSEEHRRAYMDYVLNRFDARATDKQLKMYHNPPTRPPSPMAAQWPISPRDGSDDEEEDAPVKDQPTEEELQLMGEVKTELSA